MNTFDWTLVQSFLAVAETGSYSGAARATGRSQPTIGRHIDALQAQLGAALFHRGKLGYELTQTGTAVMDQAQAMRAAAAQISLRAAGQAQSLDGTVRITASQIVGTFVLPGLLRPLMEAEPGLQIELVATDSTENLALREADIAVRMVEPTQPDLIARKIAEVPLGLFAAQSYIDRRGKPKRLDHLGDHVFLGYDQNRQMIDGIAAFGVTMRPFDFAFRTDDQVAYLEALKAGLGIGPTQRALGHSVGLIEILKEFAIPSLPVWLTAHEELRSSARVRRVFDHLADTLPGGLGA